MRVVRPVKVLVHKIYNDFWFKVVRNNSEKYEYKVLGLRRTGNHAIINWILSQAKGIVSFANDLTLMQRPETANLRETRLNRLGGKKYICHSYEDFFVHEVFDENVTFHDDYFGKSSKVFNILILRDPYNLFASQLYWKKWRGEKFRNDPEHRKLLVEQWKCIAREFLNETNFIKENKVCINYNLWVTSRDYRKGLARKLELTFSDKGRNKVSRYGSGSSVDQQYKTGKGTTMRVLERWTLVKDEPVFRQILQDSELIELSKRIFGTIPGTESLVSQTM